MITDLIVLVNEMCGLGMEPKQLQKLRIINYYIHFRLSAGALALRWNQIYPSIYNTFKKLKDIGINGTLHKLKRF